MVSGSSRTLLSASWRSLSRRCLVSSSSSTSSRSYYYISSNNSTNTIRQSSYRLRVSPSLSSSQEQHNLTSSQCRWFSSYPPHEVVGLPSLSPTMESGSIASWNKNEGDEFQAGDVLCEVETDKATVDFEAQDEGYIAKILVPAGAGEIGCGDPIMITVESEEDIAAFADYTAPAAAAAAAAATPAAPPTPTPAATPPPAPPVTPTPPTPAPTPPATGGRIIASPLAFQKAKEMGYDISQIIGTGPGGRIIAADVVEYTPATITATATTPTTPIPPPAATPSLPPPAPITGADYTDYPLAASSLSLAASLAQAKQSIPHYYLTIDLSLDKMLALRSSLSGEADVSLQSFLIKAAAKAMTSVPSVNASWMETFVRQYDNVDINVVMRNEGGSFQPCLPSVQSMGIAKIEETVGGLLETTDVPAENDKMGTFTIFNGGMYGMASSAMIIRQPQACALSLGVAEKRLVPGEEDGGVKESVMMTATLSCDHRVVDGAVGAQWLQAFKTCVEHPETLLL